MNLTSNILADIAVETYHNRGLSIVGASRNNGDREKDDFYPTPGYCTEALLTREDFSGNIFEPAAGELHITNVLTDHGFDVYSSDLIDRGVDIPLCDFLQYDGRQFDNVITNPPFKLALEFILKAKTVAKNKIAMFAKTALLESEERRLMFEDAGFPLATMYQFSKRVSLYKNGVKMKNSGMIAFAWFVWDKDHIGEPRIRWI